MKRLFFGSVIALAGLACAALPAGAQDDKAGVAAAVNPQATAQPPNQKTEVLHIGQNVIRNERITTQNEGQVQLLFVDGSTLTLGPNSEIVIDEFVYDPQKQIGSMTATVTAGLLRYVGGKVSKKKDVNFNTPSGVVTVRGGIAFINVPRNAGAAAGNAPTGSDAPGKAGATQ
ncbi:MAG TPA: FecR domain-containing protein [Alphaproteobacteria bacterium]|nr:FecR domain-containing protein [Alphaproteobacteria bacterium]